MTITETTPELTSLAAVPDTHLPLTLTALSAISHGAGTSGNTQLLRTRDVLTADGRRATVPYVSGNSLRHTLRAALAWHLVRLLDIGDGSLAKRTVDLLWSGGALTTTGNQADLDMSRRVHRLLPGLGLLGYSAKSDITAGTLFVDDVELVCQENTNRLPARLADHPHAGMPSGGLRTETFGTRHDVAGTPVDRFIQLAEADTLDGASNVLDTVQMIYDMQVIKPGAVLYSGLHLYAPTAGHVAALAVAVDEAAPMVDGRRVTGLGGRRSVGYGQCRVDVADTKEDRHEINGVRITINRRDMPLRGFQAGDVAEMRAAYEQHLRDHRDEALDLLAEITG